MRIFYINSKTQISRIFNPVNKITIHLLLLNKKILLKNTIKFFYVFLGNKVKVFKLKIRYLNSRKTFSFAS